MAVIESEDPSDAQGNNDGVESFVGNFHLAVWHLAAACDLLARIDAALPADVRAITANAWAPQSEALAVPAPETAESPDMPATTTRELAPAGQSSVGPQTTGWVHRPEDWAPLAEEWFDRQRPLYVARSLAIGLLLLSIVLFWRQGSNTLTTALWGIGALAFVATWALGRSYARPDARAWIVVGSAFVIGLVIAGAGIDRLILGIHGDESVTALATYDSIRTGTSSLFGFQSFSIPTIGYFWFVPLLQLIPFPITAVRATSALFGAGTVAMVALWGWTLGGPRLAIIAASLMACFHTALFLAHFGTSNDIAVFFATSTLVLLTIAVVRHSYAAAALAALAIAGVWFTWVGGREVLPLLVLGPVIAWQGRRSLRSLGPPALVVGGAMLLLAGPAASLGAQNLPTFVFPRSDQSLLSAGAMQATLQSTHSHDLLELAGYQMNAQLRAFEPETIGDASPGYHFARPIIDPITLFFALLGLLCAVVLVKRQRAWLLVIAPIPIAVLIGAASNEAPHYPRLALMLPAVALLAAFPLAWLSTRRLRGIVLATGLTLAICGLNLWWFYVDYPREGDGLFEQMFLLQLAEKGPVYVLTPNFYFIHETLRLLDPEHQVQPPPPDPQANATWAVIGSDGDKRLAEIQAKVPDDVVETFTDNKGRVIVTALTPRGRQGLRPRS